MAEKNDIATAPTNWQALLLSMAIPLLVAFACVHSALQPSWDDSGEWAIALLALVPLEFVRALVLTILGDTFSSYQGPVQAVRYFLFSLCILVVLLLIGAVWILGIGDFVAAMADPHTWAVIVPVAALIVVDGLVSVFFFRGDAKAQGARLQAVADDAGDLFGLALWPTPVLLLIGYVTVCGLRQAGWVSAAWIPEPGAITGEMLRSAALFYAAAYFLVKAASFGYVQTSRFNRSGQRLLGGRWVGRVQARKHDERVADQSKEAERVRERRRALGAVALRR